MAEQLFRGINNHNQIRKSVLESSKDLIFCLKSYQKILQLRKQRSELAKDLKVQIKEINVITDRLKDHFSADLISKFRKEHRKNKTTEHKKSSSKIKLEKDVVEPSELAQLESKLSAIESKLKGLS